MKNRVFIIHGWDGYPEEGWFPWLKRELEARGFEVQVLAMPHPERPTITGWMSHLTKAVDAPDENTYFVGHSIGCQAILRYLQTVNAKTGGAVLVAPWLKLSLETEEEKEIAKPWLETEINFQKIKIVINKITVIFSDNDDFVPLEENKLIFQKELSPEIIVEHDKGHFSGSDGVTELPSALNAVLEMTKY